MPIPRSFAALGIDDRTLSDEDRTSLDERGFAIMPGMLAAAEISRMRAEMEGMFERERIGTAGGPADCDFLEDRSDAFDVCLTHPRLLAAVHHVLRDEFVSCGVHARPNLPGNARQGLHADWGGPLPVDGAYQVCNSLWLLGDFTAENGATRVVPGSHRWNATPDVGAGTHPDEIQLCAPAGSVVVFNSHLWHGACANRSDRPRPNLTSFWRRRSAHHAFPTPEPSQRTLARLPEAARFLCRDRASDGRGDLQTTERTRATSAAAV